MNALLIPTDETALRKKVQRFWQTFTSGKTRPKFVFGCNVYGASLLDACHVDGFIDDFSSDRVFRGRPIIRSNQIPPEALVIAASGGMPITVGKKLDELGVNHLDYFGLQRWSGADLKEIVFNEGFREEFREHRSEYGWTYGLLSDQLSRDVFQKIVTFRYCQDLSVMEGFTDRQSEQYFEPFLDLKTDDEVFVDVGGFDGGTTLQFMKLCPRYKAVYVFEPEHENFVSCQKRLVDYPRVRILNVGLSDEKAELSFLSNGSASTVSKGGEFKIKVERMDDLELIQPTFMKMDIEGSEALAIAGAREVISKHTPRLAISAYHKAGDLWRIPRQVLGLHPGYQVYLRHYTESIYETVMFFIPNELAGRATIV